MKILCLVCEHAGHLDFGGGGFLKIASELAQRGHTVHWLTPEANAQRLKSKGFKAAVSAQVGNLFLIPFIHPDRIKSANDEFEEKLKAIRDLTKTAAKYDIIICDRLLALGPLLAKKARTPCIVMGTPDTCFRLGTQFPEEISSHYEDYDKVYTKFCKTLGISTVSDGSFWARSTLLNISFMGKNFYQNANPEASAYVHHFEDHNPKTVESTPTKRIGFSFGNTGVPHKMLSLIKAFASTLSNNLDKENDANVTIEVYAGRDAALEAQAKKTLGSAASVFGWIDFRDKFQSLDALVCFGGIGTLWEASNLGIPVATLPDIGDQLINSRAVERLGLGIQLDHRDVTAEKNIDALYSLLNDPGFKSNCDAYRNKNNFSDTISSVCDKIESSI